MPRDTTLRLPSPAAAFGPAASAASEGFARVSTSDLSNPKIAVLFTSLLPQFVAARSATLMPFLLLGSIFVAMTLIWLCAYALVAVKASETLRRPPIAKALERFTGIVLIGFGLRLATESR